MTHALGIKTSAILTIEKTDTKKVLGRFKLSLICEIKKNKYLWNFEIENI